MLYAFSRSYMEAVTDDDNLPGNSHVLTKYIGWEGLELEDVNQIEVDMNQNFLICSDGFYALMEKEWFAHYSYVIMDEAHAKPAIKQVAHFKNHNVGLLTLSVDGNIEIHYRPKKQPPVDPKMQILLSENILYQ